MTELAEVGFGTAALDLSDPAGVADLVSSHSDIVLISGGDLDRLAQHISVIEAAKNADARHVYYTSGVRAGDGQAEINADHKATEDALIASGIKYTILRNTWYIENYIQAMAGPADIAEAMSVVLERDVTYVPVSPDELRMQLVRSGMSDGLAGFLVSLDETIAAGTFSRIGDDLSRLIGQPTTGLVEGLTGEPAP